MALNKQKVSLPFASGIDTKTDDKQLKTGALTVLENVLLSSPGKLKKRNGYNNIILKDSYNANITNLKKLSKFKNELNLYTENSLYSYIESIDKWSNKGKVQTILPDSTQIVRTDEEQSKLDSIHTGGLNAYVWEDSNGISLSLLDSESNSFLINSEILSSTGTNPKIVARNNEIYAFYIDSSTIKYRKFSIYAFNNIESEITIVASLSSNEAYDVELVDDRITIAYSESSSNDLAFIQIEQDDSLTSIITVVGAQPRVAINLSKDSASRIICAYYDGTDSKIIIFNYNLSVKILSETSLETITNVTNITAVESSSENYTILYEVSNTDTYNHYIKKQTITLAGSLGTPSILFRSVGLTSKLFMHSNNSYFTMLHDNTLQSTYFLADVEGNIVSKISPNIGGDLISSSGLPRISQINSNKYLLVSQIKGRLVEENGTFFSLLGVNGTTLDFEPESQYKNSTLASNLHIAGGYLKMYDGAEVTEHGFHLYPEGIERNGDSPSDGQLPVGTYNYKALYAWTDAQGTLHRSAPSIGLEVDLNSVKYPTGTTSGLNKEITYTSATSGDTRNDDTITIQVLAAAANTSDSVLVTVTGTIDAVVITITPNDGTNNSGVPVYISTAQISEIVTTGSVAGKNTTLTDTSSLLDDLSAGGGDDTLIADGGEGDGAVATLEGGDFGGRYSTGITSGLNTEITYRGIEKSNTRDGDTVTSQVLATSANPGKTVLANIAGDTDNVLIYITPNDGTLNRSPATITTINYPSTVQMTLTSDQIRDRNGDNITINVDTSIKPTYPTVIITGTVDNVTINVQSIDSALNVLSTAELVEALNTGAVSGKTIVYSDTSGLTSDITFSGGTATILFTTYIETVTLVAGGASAGPINLTTAELAELVANGSVSGKTVTVTDPSSLLNALSATGGDSTILVDGGEGDLVSATLSGGIAEGGGQQQTIKVPTLRLTDKENVIIELYRTEESGTVFYKLPQEAENDKAIDSVDIIDNTTSDEDLINNEILYTTGDVLENISAPSGSIIENFKSRIFTTTPKSRKWVYSKIQYEGFPVEFNDSLGITISEKGGDNVAAKTMDDKLILLRRSSIYYISGDGPNNVGEQDTFTEPELISSEIGCIEPDSVILTPDGIMFKSKKGIYLLSRSLNLTYIGAPVEAFNNLTISSAIMIPTKNQVRFTTLEGDCIVYNYIQKKWSTYTNHKALSAVDLKSDYYYIRPDDLVYKENENHDDNGSSIKTKIESGWISFAAVQGYQRVYRLLLLGEFKSEHKLKIRVAYNFIDAYTQEKIVDVSEFTDATAYGDSSPYGAESTYGAKNQYQIRLDLETQKCESIKISIEDIQDDAGESFEISNIMFVVGAKTGEYKTDESHNNGTSSE